jgi:hypothetical protein
MIRQQLPTATNIKKETEEEIPSQSSSTAADAKANANNDGHGPSLPQPQKRLTFRRPLRVLPVGWIQGMKQKQQRENLLRQGYNKRIN